MIDRGWSAEFYHDSRGNSPVEDYIEVLTRENTKLAAKVVRAIRLLEVYGPALSMPHARPIRGEEFRELRAQAGSNISRVFYIATVGRRIILLHAFTKKSQKTPQRELEIARNRLAEVRQRGV